MRRWMSVLRTPLGLTATVLTVGVLVLAVVAPILWTDDADAVDTSNILAGPSADHWAGTDNLGRDIFYRTLVATRLTVELALAATAIAVVVGLLLGTAAFLLGRRSGRLVNAGINIAVAFPGILLALFFAVIFGVGATGAVLAIGFAGAPAFGRLTQTRTSPSRWSSTPPSAPAARCSPSPACRSSAWVCSSRSTTGAGCSTTASARSTSTRLRRSHPAPPSSSPVSRSTCSASP
jgi:hypothetical protein